MSVSVTPRARAASRLFRMSASSSVMSARSKWVTWGMIAADSVMRSAIVRRRCDSGARSTGPHCSNRGSGGASAAGASGVAAAAAGLGGAAARRGRSRGSGAHVVVGDAAARAARRHRAKIDAQLARQPARGGRRGNGLASGRRAAGATDGGGATAGGAAMAGDAATDGDAAADRPVAAERGSGAATVPLTASAKVTSTAPTFTVWPGSTWILSTRPPIGDGISTRALSVSTSSRGASSWITSPSWTRTATISASVRPSPRSGRTNGRAIAAQNASVSRAAATTRGASGTDAFSRAKPGKGTS